MTRAKLGGSHTGVVDGQWSLYSASPPGVVLSPWGVVRAPIPRLALLSTPAARVTLCGELDKRQLYPSLGSNLVLVKKTLLAVIESQGQQPLIFEHR